MPSKNNSNPTWIENEIREGIRKRMKEDAWTWGMTKYIDLILRDFLRSDKKIKDLL